MDARRASKVGASAVAGWGALGALLVLVVAAVSVGAQEAAPGDLPEPLVLYNLMNAEADLIPNVATAANAPDLPLQVVHSAVQREPDGVWITQASPMLRTPGSARALVEALSGGVELRAMQMAEFTVEAVITPADTAHEGPARIVTLSADPYRRCFTLGQQGDQYILRIRTTDTDENGTPDIVSTPGALEPRAQHVVATFGDDVARIYVDGIPVAEEARTGNFADWDPESLLVLGNEATGDRPWAGGFHLVAIYDIAMSPEQVQARYNELVATL